VRESARPLLCCRFLSILTNGADVKQWGRLRSVAAIAALGLATAALPTAVALAAPGAAATASLRVAVTGLPHAVGGLVTVTGPAHYSKKLKQTTTLTHLVAGTYQVSASPVQSKGTTYVPTVTGGTQKLAKGRTGNAKADYFTHVPSTTKSVPGSAVTSVTPVGTGKQIVVKSSSAPKPGDIIAVGQGAATPDGLLAKVTGVQRHGSTVTLTTQPATLQEAMPQGEFTFSPAGDLSPMSTQTVRAGNTGPAARALAAKPLSLDQALKCGAGAEVKLTGSVATSIKPFLHASWHGRHSSLTGSVTAKLDADIKAEVTGTAGCTLSSVNLGGPHPLGSFVVFIGGWPVVVVPELQLTVQGSASTTASETAEVSAGATGTAGLSYADGQLTKISSLTFSRSGQQPTLTASGDAKLSVGADVTLALYGAGGPTVGIEPGLELKADSTATPWWTLDATLGASASMQVPALGISTKKIQFFNPPLSYEVAHASTGPKGSVVFSQAPGTSAPPANLGPYTMKPFAADTQPEGPVDTVQSPTGPVGFSQSLTHYLLSDGSWQTWSNGYTGDVYATGTSGSVTLTLPPGTKAFYFYGEPTQYALYSMTATSDDGTTSGAIPVQGQAGAQYFGFYATGSTTLNSITISGEDPTGSGIGEFAISS
jgi:hypothetical protein